MGRRPTILRIPSELILDNSEVNLDNKVKETLSKIIGITFDSESGKLKDCTIEAYSDGNDVKQVTLIRMEALQKAFAFMLDARGCKRPDLVKFAQECSDLIIKEVDINKDETAQKALGYYTQCLIDILCRLFKLEHKDALEELNRADQYYLFTQLRPKIATVSKMPKMPGHYFVQYDEPLRALSNKTIKELNCINDYAKKHGRNSPVFPEWFKSTEKDKKIEPIREEVRLYILRAKALKKPDKDILDNLNKLHDAWVKYKDKLDPKTKEVIKKYVVLNDKKDNAVLPSWLKKFSDEAIVPDEICRLISDYYLKGYGPDDLKKQIGKIKMDEIPDTAGLPAWYFFLDDFERALLVKAVESVDDLREVSLSSRLRSLGGIANYLKHKSIIIKKSGTVVKDFGDKFRGANLASRDNHDWPMTLQYESIINNLSLLPKGSAYYITTLITPVKIDYPLVGYWVNEIAKTPTVRRMHPDSWLQEMVQTALINVVNATFVNLPLNSYGAKYTSRQENLKSLIKYFIEESGNPKLADLKPLLYEAQKLLNNEGIGSAPFTSVNLRLAAIFAIAGKRLGVNFGTCVSGKDRYGVFMAYIDAMECYEVTYKEWAPFEKGENKIFNALVMKILRTKHQSKVAATNAEGADGVQNLHDYLSYIYRQEDKTWIAQQNQLAITNEVKKICKTFAYKEGMVEPLYQGMMIGRDKCSKLNTLIHAIIQEETWWRNANSPDGITQIKRVCSPLKQKSSKWCPTFSLYGSRPSQISNKYSLESRDPIFVFADILKIVKLKLASKNSYRCERTQKFYDIFAPLANIDCVSANDFERISSSIKEQLSEYSSKIKLEHITVGLNN